MVRRVSVLALLLSFCIASAAAESPRQRHFSFTYAFTVREPDKGKPLSIWFPIASGDAWQKVRIVSAKGDLPLRQTRESQYGDRMFYAQTPSADRQEYHFEVVYDVVRSERIGLRNAQVVRQAARPAQANPDRFLAPEGLVPITGRPAELARQETMAAVEPLQKARVIYDYVFRTMRYDKSGTGWGRGDTLWACDSKRGNCTDFHSLFASMARSQGIPVRFAIGFQLPQDKHDGEISGYHCWADFYAENSWLPVDISEAWKDPSKKDYYFGAHDENRVQFSIGRDIRLNPRQAGESLNYFVYPYVESNGKKYENVSNEFSFMDQTAVRVQATAK